MSGFESQAHEDIAQESVEDKIAHILADNWLDDNDKEHYEALLSDLQQEQIPVIDKSKGGRDRLVAQLINDLFDGVEIDTIFAPEDINGDGVEYFYGKIEGTEVLVNKNGEVLVNKSGEYTEPSDGSGIPKKLNRKGLVQKEAKADIVTPESTAPEGEVAQLQVPDNIEADTRRESTEESNIPSIEDLKNDLFAAQDFMQANGGGRIEDYDNPVEYDGRKYYFASRLDANGHEELFNIAMDGNQITQSQVAALAAGGGIVGQEGAVVTPVSGEVLWDGGVNSPSVAQPGTMDNFVSTDFQPVIDTDSGKGDDNRPSSTYKPTTGISPLPGDATPDIDTGSGEGSENTSESSESVQTRVDALMLSSDVKISEAFIRNNLTLSGGESLEALNTLLGLVESGELSKEKVLLLAKDDFQRDAFSIIKDTYGDEEAHTALLEYSDANFLGKVGFAFDSYILTVGKKVGEMNQVEGEESTLESAIKKLEVPSLKTNMKLSKLASEALIGAFGEGDISVDDIVLQLQKLLDSGVTNYQYNQDLFLGKDGHPNRVKGFSLQSALWILGGDKVQGLLGKIDTGFGDAGHLAAGEYFTDSINQLTPEHVQKLITELSKYQGVIHTLEKHKEKIELSGEQSSILDTARTLKPGDVTDGDYVRAVYLASLGRNLHKSVPYVFKGDVDVKDGKILPKKYANESVISQIKAGDYVGIDLAPFATGNIDNVIATGKVNGSVVEVITYKNGTPEVMNYDFSGEGAKVWRLRSINPQGLVEVVAKDSFGIDMSKHQVDIESYEGEKSSVGNELFLSPSIRRQINKYFPNPENITTTQTIAFLEQIPSGFEFKPSRNKPPEIRALSLILQLITANGLGEGNTVGKIDAGFGGLKSNSRKEFMRFQQEKLGLDPENPNEAERPSLVMNDFTKKALIDYLKTGGEHMIESKEDPNSVYSEAFKKRLIPAAEKLGISPHIIQTVAFIEAKGVTDATRFEPHINKRIVRERAAYDDYAKKMTIKYQGKVLEGLVNFGEGSPISPQDKSLKPDTSKYDNYASLMTTKYQGITDINSDPRLTKEEKTAIPGREEYNTYLFSMASKYNPEGLKGVMVDPDTSNLLSDGDRKAIPRRRYPPDGNITQLSTSYSTFQIMGFNYKIAGYDSVDELVASISSGGVEAQSMAFANFVLANPTMHRALQNADWHTFARGYNGPAYAKNRYAQKLAKYSAMFA